MGIPHCPKRFLEFSEIQFPGSKMSSYNELLSELWSLFFQEMLEDVLPVIVCLSKDDDVGLQIEMPELFHFLVRRWVIWACNGKQA